MFTPRAIKLYCEGGSSHPLRNEPYTMTEPGTEGMLVHALRGSLTTPLVVNDDTELAFYDATIIQTPEGAWAQTDGAGVCPICLGAPNADIRICSPDDVAVWRANPDAF